MVAWNSLLLKFRATSARALAAVDRNLASPTAQPTRELAQNLETLVFERPTLEIRVPILPSVSRPVSRSKNLIKERTR